MTATAETVTIRGTLARVFSERGNWFAGSVETENGRVSFSGVAARIPAIDTEVELTGAFETHPKFGEQFKFSRLTELLPTTQAGVIRMLCSLPGIGPVRAKMLHEKLGNDAVRVVMQEPERLREIPGMGKWADEAADTLREHADNYQMEQVLCDMEFGDAMRANIIKHFRTPKALTRVLQTNPYKLVSVPRVSFSRVDAAVLKLGKFSPDSPFRAGAACVEAVKTAADDGNTWVDVNDIPHWIAALKLKHPIGTDLLDAGLRSACSEEMLVPVAGQDGSEIGYALPDIYTDERYIAERLRGLASRQEPVQAAGDLQALCAGLTDEQAAFVHATLDRNIVVLTGGPGTGKTHSLRTACAALANVEKVVLAPTGKAAVRAAEMSGLPACTIHRFALQVLNAREAGERADTPQLAIVDEASMISVDVLAMLLRACTRADFRLILVGDPDQLPSVGPGSILRDIIGAGTIPVCRLTRVMRQAETSTIIRNAHRINRGETPEMSGGAAQDWFFVDVKKGEAERGARSLPAIIERACAKYGYDVRRDVQVLAPTHAGPLGTQSLNNLMRDAFNPNTRDEPKPSLTIGGGKFRREIRLSDRVIVTRNNYGLCVVNGDQGILTSILTIDGKPVAVVTLDSGEQVRFEKPDDLQSLSPAWCMTVHKSQGSEYPMVVVICHTSQYFMLKNMGRSLLYTAVTRARQRLLLVGDIAGVAVAVESTQSAQRCTLLRDLLLIGELSQERTHAND